MSNRNYNDPNNRNNNLGFRLVRPSSIIISWQVKFAVTHEIVFRTSPFLHGLCRANILLAGLVLVALRHRCLRRFKTGIFSGSMSQYQSFFINAFGDSSQCQELNHFLRSHVVIRTVENPVSTGTQCGIQILVEYKEQNGGGEKQLKQKIDYRSSLKTEEERSIFDKLKAVRLGLAKSRNLKAAYLVCKDEHLAAMVRNPGITEEEIKSLPNGGNILLKEFAPALHAEYQRILEQADCQDTASSEEQDSRKDEESPIPF